MSETEITADSIVADATKALDDLDALIARLRGQKANINKSIALAIEERKPLARIVSAAKGRQPKESAE